MKGIGSMQVRTVAVALIFGAAIGVAHSVAAQADCITRTGEELRKGTFQVCSMCHGGSQSPVPWLSGDEARVWSQVERILKTGPLPYAGPERNSLIGKPQPDSGLTHGGGKAFSPDIVAAIAAYIRDLESQGCVIATAPVPQGGGAVDPQSARSSLQILNYVQLENAFARLTGRPNGYTMQLLQKYKSQLGYRDTRTQIDSRVPLSPVSMALVDRLLAWGCAEAVDVRGWAELNQTQFTAALKDFLSGQYGLSSIQNQVVTAALLRLETAVAAKNSVRAGRVAACYAALRTERFWLR